MGVFAVVLAAIGSYAFGAVWYMLMAKPWMAAAGVSEADIQKKDPKPFIIAFVCSVLVAGMMRHIFALAAIDTFGKALMSGVGLGLFIATPWIVTNYAFAGRPRQLMVIDGVYATVGCTIMALVLVALS